jgi:hypothetical protein
MKSLNKSILLVLLAILSVTGSYASKGLETMFLEHKVVTNSQGLKIGDNAPAFVVVSNDLKEVTVGGTKDKVQIIAFVPSIDTDTNCRRLFFLIFRIFLHLIKAIFLH